MGEALRDNVPQTNNIITVPIRLGTTNTGTGMEGRGRGYGGPLNGRATTDAMRGRQQDGPTTQVCSASVRWISMQCIVRDMCVRAYTCTLHYAHLTTTLLN